MDIAGKTVPPPCPKN